MPAMSGQRFPRGVNVSDRKKLVEDLRRRLKIAIRRENTAYGEANYWRLEEQKAQQRIDDCRQKLVELGEKI